MSIDNWIDIFGIAVNSIFGFWIVKTIQSKLANKRVLKDHFINEIKEIRNEYKSLLNNLHSNSVHPHKIIPWFKLMNIKIDDILIIVKDKYGIDENILNPYQIELRELITNNQEFIEHYKKDKIIFTEASKNQLMVFQQSNNRLFNKIIIDINDFD